MRRKRLKLILVTAILVAGLGFAWDVSRLPERQLTARAYIGTVHVYQAVGRPLLKGKVACRYRPTCSDYSIEAVQRHGCSLWHSRSGALAGCAKSGDDRRTNTKRHEAIGKMRGCC
jgi:putative component of membrane protein insertase Oxa1/YidC/SpoIIIJ protein YidD